MPGEPAYSNAVNETNKLQCSYSTNFVVDMFLDIFLIAVKVHNALPLSTSLFPFTYSLCWFT